MKWGCKGHWVVEAVEAIEAADVLRPGKFADVLNGWSQRLTHIMEKVQLGKAVSSWVIEVHLKPYLCIFRLEQAGVKFALTLNLSLTEVMKELRITSIGFIAICIAQAYRLIDVSVKSLLTECQLTIWCQAAVDDFDLVWINFSTYIYLCREAQ